MIEKTVLDYLTSELSVPVYMEMPETMPDSFAILDKTGSGRVNRLNSVTFAIQSYAPSMLEAAELNEQVKNAMDHIIDTCDISHSGLNSDYNYTYTGGKAYRYQAVYELFY